MVGVLLGALDFLAGELAGGDRVHALDALRGVAVGNGADLQGMHLGEVGDLIERQRGIVDEPHGSRFGHQRCIAHGKSPLRFAHPSGQSLLVIDDDGNWGLYMLPGVGRAMVCSVERPAWGACLDSARKPSKVIIIDRSRPAGVG